MILCVHPDELGIQAVCRLEITIFTDIIFCDMFL